MEIIFLWVSILIQWQYQSTAPFASAVTSPTEAVTTLPVPTTMMTCPSGLIRSPCQDTLPGCVPATYICNDIEECLDGHDEISCLQRSTCAPDRVSCRDGTGCIITDRYCDGTDNCMDGSDETFCLGEFIPLLCSRGMIQSPCGGQPCFPAENVCNSVLDCDQDRDERFCTNPRPQRCPRGMSPCRRDPMMCVFNEVICNGINDCQDSSDEEFCVSNACPPGMVATPCSGDFPECIAQGMICDGVLQCSGGEDELLCEIGGIFDCQSNRVPCRTLPGVCVSSLLVCNGVQMDCLDGTDEFFCGSFECPPGFVTSPCQDFLGCIESDLICNLVSDCADSSDETCTNGTELAPFGAAVGDIFIQNIDDEALGPVVLPTPIVYFGQEETLIYVSSNGLISFGSIFSDFTPTSFPRTDSSPIPPNFPPVLLAPVIAPFWTDLLFGEDGGGVFGRGMTEFSDSSFAEIVQEVDPSFADFQPQLEVIVTWFRPIVLNASSLEEEPLVAFQTILLSDGATSFAVFIYSDTDPILSTMNRQVGFDAGDGVRSATLLSIGSSSGVLPERNVFRIDGECITLASFNASCGKGAVAKTCEPFSLTADLCECRDVEAIYDPVSRSCEDVDPCDLYPCIENALCVSYRGGFDCVCNQTGFIGDGFTFCNDINECAEPDQLRCQQTCTNTISSYNCSCEDGYLLQEDGFTCEDIDECEWSPCHSSARCTNTPGSFSCMCDPFVYMEDGLDCEVSDPLVVSVSVASVSLLIISVIATLVIVGCIRIRRKYKRNTAIDDLNLTEQTEGRRDNEYFQNLRNLTVRSSFIGNVPKSLVIASCNLQIGKTIGQGEFGIVYKGLLKKGFSEGYSDTVAVKTLKGFLQKELVTDLLKECVKMQQFDHPNVLTLVGVCLDGGPAPYIIMPFMANGSLLSYLKEERENLIASPSDDNMSETQNKLLDMCIQVAKGMEYLASKRVIHRDLAARNCMIDVSFVIKVADFGLAESIDSSKDYFRQDQETAIKLPVKWLSPESINDGIFSEKTDVWAYGVTSWEIFSGGKTPYPGVHPLELSRQLESGYRMEKPLNAACPEEMYLLMKSCWEAKPDARPSFAQLLSSLSSLLESMADYLDFSTISNPTSDLPSPPNATSLK